MIPLPAYINREAWEGFCEMRRAMPKSKPFTSRAATLILYELQRIKDAGHCPNAALDQSTLRGWADVWPAKEKDIQQKPGSRADKTAEYLAEKAAQPLADTALVHDLVARVKGVRRVA